MLLAFCTLMIIAIGASAATPARIGFPVKEKNGLVSMGKPEMLKNPKVIKMEERQANKANRGKAVKKAASVKAADSPKTITLEQNLYIENFGSDDWFNYLVMLYGDDEEGNSYYIALDCYPPTKSWLSTYTTEDFSLGGSWCSAVNNLTTGYSAWISDEEVSSFSITKSSAEHYNVEGTLHDENGGVYILAGTDLYYPDPETYDMTGIKWQGYDYGDQYLGVMTTLDNAYFQLVFNVEGGLQNGKTYTASDLDMSYSWGYWKGKEIYISEFKFTKMAVLGGDEVIDITITDDKDNVYNIAYTTPKAPATFNDVYLTANTATLYDLTASAGIWQFLGESEDGEWNLSVAGMGSTLVGEYSEQLIITDFTYIGMSDLTVDLTLDYCKIDNVKVVEGPKPGDYILTADFYCYNGNCYHVTINHICPDVTNTVNATATNAKVRYDELFGTYWLTAHDDNYSYDISLQELADSYAPGETMTGIMVNATEEDLDIYEDYGYTLQMNEDGTVKAFKGSCITKQGIKFNLDFTYVLPSSTRTEDLVITEEEGELVPEDDTYTVSGTHDGKEITLIVKSDDITGQFKIADIDDLSSYYYESGTYFSVEDANISVTVENRGSKQYATVTGTILCISTDDENDRPLYNVCITVPVKNGLKRDEFDGDFIATYQSSDVTIIDHAAEEGWILLQGKNQSKQQIAMVFFAKASDPVTVIPAGTYTINSTQTEGTVFASPGLEESGISAQASFAAISDMLGLMIEKVWFIETGTVTVSNKDGKMAVQVNARNSYGNKILVGINDESPDAISSVVAEKTTVSRKTLENGQVVISKNGLRYNTQGQQIR